MRALRAGKASSLAAADIAGVGYDAFLDALQERKIPRYTSEMLREDIEDLNHLFPDADFHLERLRGERDTPLVIRHSSAFRA